ncbi:MAG: cation:proton antiporter [Lentisphaeria bacterium]|nr:cation:proton antiporter [Lentisphaeria bacterium]
MDFYKILTGMASPFVTFYKSLPDNPQQMLIAALIVIVVTGMIGGMVAKKLKQPLILGYILAGVFVGIAFKAGVGDAAKIAVKSLADIGVALLLFTMGLEFSKEDIRPVYKIAIWGTLSQVLFTLLAGTGIAYLLMQYRPGLLNGWASCFLFGAAFVSTSTAVVLKTLESKRRMGTLSSKVMIGVSIVQDLTVIPLMLVACKLDNLSSGFGEAVRPLILGAIFMFLMLTIGSKYIPICLRRVARFESKELFLFAVTGVALGIGLLSEAMQVSFSFGAFLAGIVLSDSDYGKRALYEMTAVRDLFAMLFFVSIGMMLNVPYLIQNLTIVLLLMFATSLSRTVFLAVVSWLSGYRNIIPIAMLFGMFATSEIVFIVIQTGFSAGLFTEHLYALMLSVAVCSMIAGPIMDALTGPVYDFLRKNIWKTQRNTDIVIPPPDLKDHVVIVGGGTIARSIARLLIRLNCPYKIIESDHRTFQENQKKGFDCLYGDPQQDVILNGAGISLARILLLAAPGVTENLSVISRAKQLNEKILIVARADSFGEVELLRNAKIFEIVQPKFEAGLELTRQALIAMNTPSVDIQNYLDAVRFDRYQIMMDGKNKGKRKKHQLDRMRSFTGLVELKWIHLPANCAVIGKNLQTSRLRSNYGISVVGILRGEDFTSNPRADYIFADDDILAVIGKGEDVERFSRDMGAGQGISPAAATQTNAVMTKA